MLYLKKMKDSETIEKNETIVKNADLFIFWKGWFYREHQQFFSP